MTGLELLKTVRADKRAAKTPLRHSHRGGQGRERGAARRADISNDVIAPFSLAVLKQKLSAALGEI